ncbi:MAG: hypothetical protein WD228_03615 [Mycobacterium sp.]
MDNTLDYMDQASFLGLRALGHGPVIQFTWIYEHDVDLVALRRFHRDLGRGLLGRRIERSPLPFGRHRWIAWPGPTDVDIARAPRPRSELTAWTDEQATLPIDPERGPSWRLAVLPLTSGGAAVTLVASHTVADGVGLSIAVANAVRGETANPGYPPSGSRNTLSALRTDSRATIRALPEIGRALAAALKLARGGDDAVLSRQGSGGTSTGARGEVTVPSVTAHVNTGEWDEKAASLGGTSNSLFLGVATRIGYRLGYVAADGNATLSLPVNERIADDTRGNALTGVTLSADPAGVTADLRGVRADLKVALSTLGEARHRLLAPLPLTPLIPRVLARRLESMVVGTAVIGCSNLVEIDPAVNRPDGTDADYFAIRMFEHSDWAYPRRAIAFPPVASGRIAGRVFLSVSYSDADGTTTTTELRETVRGALGDFGLTGFIE